MLEIKKKVKVLELNMAPITNITHLYDIMCYVHRKLLPLLY